MTDARGILLALIVVSLGGSYVGAGGLSSPPPPAAMSLDSSMGAALKGYRTTFALSQAQLAALSHVSATRISRLERGLDSGTTAEQDSLARALWRVFRTRYDPGTEARLARIVLRTRP